MTEGSAEDRPVRSEAPLRQALERHAALRYLAFALAAFAVVALLRLSNRAVPDPDSFYHFRHAAEYVRHGLFMSAFPWLAYSVISRFASDFGYGFHVLLIPFTFMRDPILGLKLASIVESVAVLVMLYYALKRERISCAFAWPFVLFFLSGPIVWTFFQTRPQTLTMGFAALLLSFMVVGSPWGVFLAGFATSFVHLNVVAIVPAIVALVAVVKGIGERRWEWQKWLMAIAGVCAGWLLRPNPIGSLRLEYVQTVAHEIIRQKHVPLLFGVEWLPVSPAALGSFTYFILLWVALAALFFGGLASRRHQLSRSDQTFLWSSFLLSVAFFVATVAITKRTTPLWAVFAVMFCAKVFTVFLDPMDKRPAQLIKGETRLLLAITVGVISLAVMWTSFGEHVIARRWTGMDPYALRATGQWLRENGRPGEIVYNVNWDQFPELFFWDPEHRYVSGLDPIFLYAYSEGLYWKAHHLQAGDGTDRTWGSAGPQPGGGEDTYTVLRRDFNASYIVVDRRRNEWLYQYLLGDPRCTDGFQDTRYAVFALKP